MRGGGMWFRALRQALGTVQVQLLLGLTFAQIGTATVIFHLVEKWSWIDAFYFSVITVATVGYGDFAPKTDIGKLVTVFYILLGIGVFVTATATLASQLLAAAKQEAEQHRRRETDGNENK